MIEIINQIIDFFVKDAPNLDELLQLSIKLLSSVGHDSEKYLMELESSVLNIIDYLFSYRLVGRHIVLITILQLLVICSSSLYDVYNKLRQYLTIDGYKEYKLKKRLSLCKLMLIF